MDTLDPFESGKGEYCFPLEGQLETTIDNYAQSRECYLNKQDDIVSQFMYQQAEKFAEIILHDTEQLFPFEDFDKDLQKLKCQLNETYSNRPTLEKYSSLLSSDKSLEEKERLISELLKEDQYAHDYNLCKLVLERFVISLAWEAVEKIREGAERILQLYELVLKSRPAKSTMPFLSRLSRCYIWGFDSECVILCRSVLDTAFQEKISPELCIKHLKKDKKCDFPLSDRIYVAIRERIIDEQTGKLANTVKVRGNKAIHYQPDITKRVWETIRDTIKVLEKLHR